MDITHLVCSDDYQAATATPAYSPVPALDNFVHPPSTTPSASSSLDSTPSPLNSLTALPPMSIQHPPLPSHHSLFPPHIAHPQPYPQLQPQPIYQAPNSNYTLADQLSHHPSNANYQLTDPYPHQLLSHQPPPTVTAPSAPAPPLHPQLDMQPHQQPTTHQRVECGLCGKSFSGISSHNRHVSRTHHKARPFSCPDCGLQFGQKGSLDRHTAAVHLKARPFECHFCRKGFGRKDNMKIHMTTVHLKRKPYKCDMCPKRFGGKRPLKIHRQTVHFKERPLQCPYCDKRFGQRSNLNVHMKVHKRAGTPPRISAVMPTSPIGSMDDDLSSVRLEPVNPIPSVEPFNPPNADVFPLPFSEQRSLGSPI